MAYVLDSFDLKLILGSFVEKEYGKTFEFSENPDVTLSPPAHGGKNMLFPHLVWVTTPGLDYGYRVACVKKSVVYIITEELEDDRWVVEKWDIKNKRDYSH